MARSYKKNPGYISRSRYRARLANRQIRQLPVDQVILDGGHYKRFHNSFYLRDGIMTLPRSFEAYLLEQKRFYTDSELKQFRESLYREWMKSRIK